ncbi:MAG TPA: GNAT family N-acetyltransferase [Cytophagales bacterium]|nr:GNAT family N-acetyltransferase [Cytophagales bacterium]HAA22476.1 GNAT family N-acetyltransferase [Cytophagales bacterium]HAP61579.1 GNAT family N-acetyltransferase [Cytophagales bacterium]
MKIRNYQPHDFEAVIRLIQLNTPTYFAAEEEADLRHYLHHELDLYFVAEEADQVVGAGGINRGFDEGKTARLSWDFVDPEHQSQGIGGAITQHRLGLLRQEPGVEKVVVRTTQLVYRFYEKQGLTLRYQEKDYWAPGFDLYLLELSLTKS